MSLLCFLFWSWLGLTPILVLVFNTVELALSVNVFDSLLKINYRPLLFILNPLYCMSDHLVLYLHKHVHPPLFFAQLKSSNLVFIFSGVGLMLVLGSPLGLLFKDKALIWALAL